MHFNVYIYLLLKRLSLIIYLRILHSQTQIIQAYDIGKGSYQNTFNKSLTRYYWNDLPSIFNLSFDYFKTLLADFLLSQSWHCINQLILSFRNIFRISFFMLPNLAGHGVSPTLLGAQIPQKSRLIDTFPGSFLTNKVTDRIQFFLPQCGNNRAVTRMWLFSKHNHPRKG